MNKIMLKLMENNKNKTIKKINTYFKPQTYSDCFTHTSKYAKLFPLKYY